MDAGVLKHSDHAKRQFWLSDQTNLLAWGHLLLTLKITVFSGNNNIPNNDKGRKKPRDENKIGQELWLIERRRIVFRNSHKCNNAKIESRNKESKIGEERINEHTVEVSIYGVWLKKNNLSFIVFFMRFDAWLSTSLCPANNSNSLSQ